MAAITAIPTHLAWPSSSGPQPGSVYRSRRIVAAALFLGILLAGSWTLGALGGGPLTASEADSGATPLVVQPVSRTTHVVASGDTLWSIARGLQPMGDVRPLVDALAEARGGRPLQVGERIVLPSLAAFGR